MFQFHNGTIKTSVHAGGLYLFFCFNSITVQLRQENQKARDYNERSFNSITVQLRLYAASSETLYVPVSIP